MKSPIAEPTSAGALRSRRRFVSFSLLNVACVLGVILGTPILLGMGFVLGCYVVDAFQGGTYYASKAGAHDFRVASPVFSMACCIILLSIWGLVRRARGQHT